MNSNKPWLEYKESDFHRILTKDLWRTDLTEDEINTYIRDLRCYSELDYKAAYWKRQSFIHSKQEIFYRLGGSTIRIGIMNRYKDNIPTLLNCFATVKSVSESHSRLYRQFFDAGIVDCITAIMNEHPDDVHLQKLCLDAIILFATRKYYGAKQLVLGTTTTTTTDDNTFITNDSTDNNTGLRAVRRNQNSKELAV